MSKSTATFYIEVDTYWQNSKSYFVGPFFSRKAAAAWIEQDSGPEANVWLSTSTCGGDIRDAWRIYPTPLSKTAADRQGMRTGERDNTISPDTAPTAQALSDARRQAMEMA